MDYSQYIVERLESARDVRGTPVTELARRTDIPYKRLWSILDGQRELRADEFVRLSIVLDMGTLQFIPHDMLEHYVENGRRTLEDFGAGSPTPSPSPPSRRESV